MKSQGKRSASLRKTSITKAAAISGSDLRNRAAKATKAAPLKPTDKAQAAARRERIVEAATGSEIARKLASSLVVTTTKALGKKTSGRVSVLSAGGSLSRVTEYIPSRFVDVDRILGGGWAIGRASEVAGMEASGKSALAHCAIAECQRMGGVAALLDFEHSLDEDKCRNVGIDPASLVYCSPESLEEGWEITWKLLEPFKNSKKPKAPLLIVWDSVAAAIPQKELEADMVDAAVGVHARGMARGCRRMYRELGLARAHVMWINQFRSKMNTGGGKGKSWSGPQYESTGGHGPRFAASQRVTCTRVMRLKDSTEAGVPPSGYLVKVETEKCRLAPPHRRSEFVLNFTHGPSAALTTLHLLVSAGVIKTRPKGQLGTKWWPDTFRRRDWLELWGRKDFRRGALGALSEVGVAGGAVEFKRAHSKGEDDDETEEGSED